jgi:serine/threonine protein kinase
MVYLLMEYVDGMNLRQAMKEERFSPEQAIAWWAANIDKVLHGQCW